MRFVACFIALAVLPRIHADSPFERAVGYAHQVAALNGEFSELQRLLENSVAQAEQIGKLLQEAASDSRAIQAAGFQQEAATAARSLQLSMQAAELNSVANTNAVAGRREGMFAFTLTTGQFLLEASKLSQLQFAQQATTQRQRELFTELRRLTSEMRQAVESSRILFERYRNLADAYGLKSRLEWSAAERELADVAAENLGARFLRAVTLRRLGDFVAAEAELAELSQLATIYQPHFRAAHGELLSILGESPKAKKVFGNLVLQAGQLADVHAYRGLASPQDKLDFRVQCWERALKLGGNEIPLRRNLAIVLATEGRENQLNARKALEHAELASAVSAHSEWSVELALALALNAVGKKSEAIAAAENAMELAGGECLTYSAEILDRIQQDQTIKWDFVNH